MYCPTTQNSNSSERVDRLLDRRESENLDVGGFSAGGSLALGRMRAPDMSSR